MSVRCGAKNEKRDRNKKSSNYGIDQSILGDKISKKADSLKVIFYEKNNNQSETGTD